jgi:hypothetical protein
MITPSRFMQHATETLAALGGIAVAISILLLGVDRLNHLALSVTHLTALVISGSVATFAGVLGRKASPWFGWLAYGVMIGSATLALPLIAAVVLTGKLPNDPSFLGVLVITALLFVCAFPAVLIARKQARGFTSAI